jgi:ADP-ribose pyrophosphatase
MSEKVMASNQVYQGRRVGLRVDTVTLPSGRQTTREIAEYPNCVAIVALDTDNSVVLVRQYRHAVGQDLLEVPAGGVDPGEEPRDAARRELEEETGYRAGKMQRIGGAYTAPGYSTEFMHLFLATELEPGSSRVEEDEIIEVVPVPLKRIRGLIESGDICDGKSIIGLLTLLASVEKRKA